MEFLGIRQDFQPLFLERNHKEGSLSEKNSSGSTEPEFSPIQARVEMIQTIAGSGLASSCLTHLKEAHPGRVLINSGSRD